jgi:hypothetical protein
MDEPIRGKECTVVVAQSVDLLVHRSKISRLHDGQPDLFDLFFKTFFRGIEGEAGDSF